MSRRGATAASGANNPVDLDYLLVGGGGGPGLAGSGGPGAGGAGGYLPGAATLLPGSYPILIGAAGSAGVNGGDTTFNGLTALGGGCGGRAGVDEEYGGGNGATGGSGGGGGEVSSGVGSGGPGTPGQGYAGASGVEGVGGGGGGGAGGASGGSEGGVGVSSSITGSPVTRATGGQGPGNGAPPANSGNGAGGRAGAAAAGVCIVRYPTGSATCAGGTITTSGGYTIHTFTADGTLTVG